MTLYEYWKKLNLYCQLLNIRFSKTVLRHLRECVCGMFLYVKPKCVPVCVWFCMPMILTKCRIVADVVCCVTSLWIPLRRKWLNYIRPKLSSLQDWGWSRDGQESQSHHNSGTNCGKFSCQFTGALICVCCNTNAGKPIHRVKWRHISTVAIRSPFCRSRPSYCA